MPPYRLRTYPYGCSPGISLDPDSKAWVQSAEFAWYDIIGIPVDSDVIIVE